MLLQGNVGITTTSNATGSTPFAPAGNQGDLLVSELHGKHFSANYRGKVFVATAAAVTVPAIAASLVSVFTLWNPPGSGVNMELIETTVVPVLATTVVDGIGWYFSTAALTAAGTFTTAGTPQPLNVGAGFISAGKFYSAYTHSGTPVLVDLIGGFGATTDAVSSMPQKFYDGRLILPPGIAMSIAMTTAAGTGSGLTLSASWQESPV